MTYKNMAECVLFVFFSIKLTLFNNSYKGYLFDSFNKKFIRPTICRFCLFNTNRDVYIRSVNWN